LDNPKGIRKPVQVQDYDEEKDYEEDYEEE
jgi:hypothetical protein